MRRFLEHRMKKEEDLVVALRLSILQTALMWDLAVMSMDELREHANKVEALADALKRYKFLRELY